MPRPMYDVNAANRALLMIGVEPASDISSTSPVKQGRVMDAILDDCKRAVLMEFPWHFATYTSVLIRTAPYIQNEWNYQYNVPSNVLQVHRVFEEGEYKKCAEFILRGKTIATNTAVGHVEYTMFVEDLTEWPENIMACLYARLAFTAAIMLSGDAQKSNAYKEEYRYMVEEAKAADSVQENIIPARSAHYIEVRS